MWSFNTADTFAPTQILKILDSPISSFWSGGFVNVGTFAISGWHFIEINTLGVVLDRFRMPLIISQGRFGSIMFADEFIKIRLQINYPRLLSHLGFILLREAIVTSFLLGLILLLLSHFMPSGIEIVYKLTEFPMFLSSMIRSEFLMFLWVCKVVFAKRIVIFS